MATATGQGHTDGVGGRGNGPNAGADRAHVKAGVGVQRDDSGDVLQDPLANDFQRATGEFFFGGLEDHANAPGEIQMIHRHRRLLHQQPVQRNGRAQTDRGVDVMTTRMGNAIMYRSVWQPSFFFDRQSINISPDTQHYGAGADIDPRAGGFQP